MESEDAWIKLREEIAGCRRCPRLVAYREEIAQRPRRAFAGTRYWARPLPGFGDTEARIAIVGLAPAAHGGNRTGRMFTGDASGDFLVAALWRAGLASQPHSRGPDDGLELSDVFLTAAVRCAPPENRPQAEERARCLPYLVRELELLRRLQVVIALGAIAWQGILAWQRAQGRKAPAVPFRHGAEVELEGQGIVLLASYHPSWHNTATGRLTAPMLDAILARAKARRR